MTRLIAIIAAVLLLPLAARAVMPGLLAVIAADEGSASPDLIVTGSIVPDATGNYFEDGTYGGKAAYRNADSSFWIWWSTSFNYWFLTNAKGDKTNWWIRDTVGDPVTGTYQNAPGAQGIATVAAP